MAMIFIILFVIDLIAIGILRIKSLIKKAKKWTNFSASRKKLKHNSQCFVCFQVKKLDLFICNRLSSWAQF